MASRSYGLHLKESTRAYRGSDLWVPKAWSEAEALRRFLTYDIPLRNGGVMEVGAYGTSTYHDVFPRYTDETAGVRIQRLTVMKYQKLAPVRFRERITLRPRQEPVWNALSAADHGVLNIMPGAGKTVLALKKIAQVGLPAVVIVDQTHIVEQWFERIEEFLPGTRVGLVKGEKQQWDADIVVASIRTLVNMSDELDPELRLRFGLAVYDEVHHESSAVLRRACTIFSAKPLGLTATLAREDGLEFIYLAHVGRVVYSDKTPELKAQIVFLTIPTELPLNADVNDKTGAFNAPKFWAALGEMPDRNEIIAGELRKALSRGRKILALSHSVPHLKLLAGLFPDAGLIIGEVDYRERGRILKDHALTFGTMHLAREALDEPSLDTVFFLTPFRAFGSFQQGLGRSQRKYAVKKQPLGVVIEDKDIGPSRGMCRILRRELKANRTEFEVLMYGKE